VESSNDGSFGFDLGSEISGSSSDEFSLSKTLSFFIGFHFFINNLFLLRLLLGNWGGFFWFDSFFDFERYLAVKDEKNLVGLVLNIVNGIALIKTGNEDRFSNITDDSAFHLISIIHDAFENIEGGETLFDGLFFGVNFFELPVVFFVDDFVGT
jgi:hypothetical protein